MWHADGAEQQTEAIKYSQEQVALHINNVDYTSRIKCGEIHQSDSVDY